jgi:hypothetical protein
MRPIATRHAWSPEELYEEYEVRIDLMSQLVGSLYPSVLEDELEQIIVMCKGLFSCHPNWLIEQKHFAASYTDEHGLTHDLKNLWVGRPQDAVARRDKPAKVVTCLECIGQ